MVTVFVSGGGGGGGGDGGGGSSSAVVQCTIIVVSAAKRSMVAIVTNECIAIFNPFHDGTTKLAYGGCHAA